MIIAVHVVAALLSLASTTWLYLSPSRSKFRMTYGLIGTTVASGSLMILVAGSSLLRTCVSGLLYLGVVITGVLLAQQRFAKVKQTNR